MLELNLNEYNKYLSLNIYKANQNMSDCIKCFISYIKFCLTLSIVGKIKVNYTGFYK